MAADAPLRVVPCRLRDARRFVDLHHRHNAAPRGGLFAIGAAVDTELVAVVIIGRPVARHYDNGTTAELTRCATDGTAQAASMLYAAAWRACKAMGYRRLITYTRADEPGTSLRAAGWRVIAQRPPRPHWTAMSRPADTTRWDAEIARTLWEAG